MSGESMKRNGYRDHGDGTYRKVVAFKMRRGQWRQLVLVRDSAGNLARTIRLNPVADRSETKERRAA